MELMGFRELPHTADVAIIAWGSDTARLFEQAALGMNAVAGIRLATSPRQIRTVHHVADDLESLLVAFLSDLVFFIEQGDLGFDKFELDISQNSISGRMEGARIIAVAKPIKAVTFHNLEITKTGRGYKTQIVFDI